MTRTILITGCSTGIGWTCALGMRERGWRVFATARQPEDLARLEAEGVDAVHLDYADPASVTACANEVAARTGGKLDALFNNGAFGQPGAVEDLRREVLEQQFACNVFGWHQLTRDCLPLMRANGGGRIVQCSSVLGLVALKWRGAYNASKFAIEALADTLRLELRGSGIFVSLIEPGPIASKFVETSLKNFDRNIDEASSHYKEAYAKQRARLGRGGSARYKLGPEAVLEKLVHAVESPRPRARYYVTKPTHYMAIARRILPQRVFDYVLDKASDQ
ncbi:SDR family oxidoreductase [Aestuariivirga sp.]|uniref:SDR family oxidoreductase n=1 Tax=Aestuariivirga sp. TaxID=2650926 RepID=UPI0025C03C42|nr:SDR family oxidoreductase [Aestuariivirga sp.]